MKKVVRQMKKSVMRELEQVTLEAHSKEEWSSKFDALFDKMKRVLPYSRHYGSKGLDALILACCRINQKDRGTVAQKAKRLALES